MKKFVYSLVTLILTIIIIELFCASAITFIWRKKHFTYLPTTQNMLSPMQQSRIRQLINGQTKYIDHHGHLGWTVKPGGDNELYRANAYGFRTLNPLKNSGPSATIATYGDSFVHGDEVQNTETWQEQARALNSQLHILNFGVPGYGTDQSYLKYKTTASQWKPDIAVLGFMSDNLKRNVNTFRPFYAPRTQFPMAKPRFELISDGLQLIPNPLPERLDYQQLLDQQQETLLRLSAHDYFYGFTYKPSVLDRSSIIKLLRILHLFYTNPRPAIFKNNTFNPASPAWQVTQKILEAFHQSVRANSSTPVILIFPTYDELNRYQHRPDHPRKHQLLLELCQRNQWHCLDLTDALLSAASGSKLDTLFAPGRHYSPSGNAVVARTFVEFLKKNQLIR